VTVAAPCVLAFDRVSVGYGGVPVLHDASLHIMEGEFVAVVGPNGSGKTTLLRVGLGLLRPDEGTVWLFGLPLERFHDWGLVGYVPQRAAADAPLPISVEEVVRTGLAGRLGLLRRPTARQRARVDHVLGLLGLAALRGRPVATLSGGQQQRVLLARALVTDPRLLVLDEPTTGVDIDARQVLRASLQHLVAAEGVAVVYVSHDPEGFEGLADRVVQVQGGRVCPAGDRDQSARGRVRVAREAPPAGGDRRLTADPQAPPVGGDGRVRAAGEP
jgi:zinc transport system ATP-binding protein